MQPRQPREVELSRGARVLWTVAWWAVIALAVAAAIYGHAVVALLLGLAVGFELGGRTVMLVLAALGRSESQ